MGNEWYDFSTPERLAYLLVGMVIATAVHWWDCKREGTELDWRPIGIVAGVSIMVFMCVQQVGIAAHQAELAKQQVELAKEMKECQAEFYAVLQVRARLSDESDTLSSRENKASSEWLKHLSNPPMGRNGPGYGEWVQGVVNDYARQVDMFRDLREQALEERKSKKYPEPTCGK